jgi:pantetheine-phosphate adenylyltransferase
MESKKNLLREIFTPLYRQYGVDTNLLENVLNQYAEPFRVYHNLDHVVELLHKIEKIPNPIMDKEVLQFAALYHDSVYIIEYGRGFFNNETRSSQYFMSHFGESKMPKVNFDLINEIILDTQYRAPQPNQTLSSTFWWLDNEILFERDLEKLLDYEDKIFSEFSSLEYPVYVKGRTDFLIKSADECNNPSLGILAEIVRNRKIRVGVYAGSFNPFHIGHLNILNKARNLFDRVILVRGINPDKSQINAHYIPNLPGVLIKPHLGLLTDCLKEIGEYSNVTLIRGLRNGKDLDYEVNQLRFMEKMYPEIQVIYINCDKEYEHVSSSALRSLSKFSDEEVKKYLV